MTMIHFVIKVVVWKIKTQLLQKKLRGDSGKGLSVYT